MERFVAADGRIRTAGKRRDGGRPDFAIQEMGEDAVEAGQIEAWPWHQCSQPGDEIQRFEDHVRRAVTPGRLLANNEYPPDAAKRATAQELRR